MATDMVERVEMLKRDSGIVPFSEFPSRALDSNSGKRKMTTAYSQVRAVSWPNKAGSEPPS